MIQAKSVPFFGAQYREDLIGMVWLRQKDGTGPINYGIGEPTASYMDENNIYFYCTGYNYPEIKVYSEKTGKKLWSYIPPDEFYNILINFSDPIIRVTEQGQDNEGGLILGIRRSDGKIVWYKWAIEGKQVSVAEPCSREDLKPHIPRKLSRPIMSYQYKDGGNCCYMNIGKASAKNVYGILTAYSDKKKIETEKILPFEVYDTNGKRADINVPGGIVVSPDSMAVFRTDVFKRHPKVRREFTVYYSDSDNVEHETEPYDYGVSGFDEDRLYFKNTNYGGFVLFKNRLWLSDSSHERIAIFNTDGTYYKSVYLKDMKPGTIDTNGKDVLVGGRHCNTVLRFDTNGNVIDKYEMGVSPAIIAECKNGDFWVSSIYVSGLGKYNAKERSLHRIDGKKNEKINLNSIWVRDMTLDDAGNLYVIEKNYDKILKLSDEGVLLKEIPINAKDPLSLVLDRENGFWIVDNYKPADEYSPRPFLKKLSSKGKVIMETDRFDKGEKNKLYYMGNLSLDRNGNLWIYAGSKGLFHITPEGKLLKKIN